MISALPAERAQAFSIWSSCSASAFNIRYSKREPLGRIFRANDKRRPVRQTVSSNRAVSQDFPDGSEL